MKDCSYMEREKKRWETEAHEKSKLSMLASYDRVLWREDVGTIGRTNYFGSGQPHNTSPYFVILARGRKKLLSRCYDYIT